MVFSSVFLIHTCTMITWKPTQLASCATALPVLPSSSRYQDQQCHNQCCFLSGTISSKVQKSKSAPLGPSIFGALGSACDWVAVFPKRAAQYTLPTQKINKLKLPEPEKLLKFLIAAFLSQPTVVDNETSSADCCVRSAMMIKGLRIRKTQETLLLFVFVKMLFIFS